MKTRDELKQALEELTSEMMSTATAPCTERKAGRSCLERAVEFLRERAKEIK